MNTSYEVRIYNAAGSLQYVLTDYLTIEIIHEINAVGICSLTISETSQAFNQLGLDWQIEVYRYRIEGGSVAIAPYVEWGGLMRSQIVQTDDVGLTTQTYLFHGWNDFLRRSIVAYYDGTADRSSFVAAKASTIAEGVVYYNCTSAGTTGDGRYRNVSTWGSYITVNQVVPGFGNTLDIECARENVLDVLQNLAKVGNIDFGLTKSGAQAWDLRLVSLWGTDRTSGSSRVVFALEFGNMRNPVMTLDRLDVKTVAIVSGQWTNQLVTVTRTSAAYDASVNSMEFAADAGQISSVNALEDFGDERLRELRARRELTFDVVQTPTFMYGRDYALGDKVLARYVGTTYTRKITQVQIVVAPDQEEEITMTLTEI